MRPGQQIGIIECEPSCEITHELHASTLCELSDVSPVVFPLVLNPYFQQQER
jgi:hypothetical protein